MSLLAATAAVDVPELLLRLFVDLVAIAVLAGLLFLRRHRRRDLIVTFAVFNIGVFAALTVIATQGIGTGVGFGLFAVLSIIRLRSEPFDNVELAYFFAALVLALVNGFASGQEPLAGMLSALVLLTIFLIDHPALHATVRRRTVTLDHIATDAAALRADLADRLAVEIVDLAITDVDYVRETTRVVVRYVAPAGTPHVEPATPEAETT